LRATGIREPLKFSLHMIPSGIISSSTSILDSFLLKQYCSLEILGIYSIACKIAAIVNVVQNTLKLSFGPFFMKHIFEQNGQAIIYRMIGFYIFPLFLVGLLLSIFTDKIIYLIHQPAYFSVIEYVPYLVFIFLASSLNVFYANGIILSKRTYLLVIPASLQLVMLLSGILLIPLYQIYGVIAAKALSVLAL